MFWVIAIVAVGVGGFWVPRRRQKEVPAWTLLSAALSHDDRLQTCRPDVDAAVQLAAEIALSEPRKFRYNRG